MFCTRFEIFFSFVFKDGTVNICTVYFLIRLHRVEIIYRTMALNEVFDMKFRSVKSEPATCSLIYYNNSGSGFDK